MSDNALPVAVIGAGPVGLAAAAHLVRRGETPLVLEAGKTVGSSIREWGHVRLFSPWQYLVDSASSELLATAGWTAPPPEELPTGHELLDRYLLPLAALPAIEPYLRLDARVVSVSRQGFDKLKTTGREQAPFVLEVAHTDGTRARHLAKAVIDASGTWTSPNPLGANGRPAEGETELADRIRYGVPDVLGIERGRYEGRHVLVVGSGHSAFNTLLDLTALSEEAPGTTITWAIRRSAAPDFGGGEADALPARGQLGLRLRRLLDSGAIQLVTDFRIVSLGTTAAGVEVAGDAGRSIGPVDEVIAATGFRPDLSVASELRLALDPVVESPVALASLIDPNLHSCGTVPPHGFEELRHPEPDFYTAGMKSYGRAPTFLLLTGYEQVRSIVAALTGDLEAAREVKLKLPETGVCNSDALTAADACCGSVSDASPAFIELLSVDGSRADVDTGCCGGPSPDADACCAQDAEAKAAGETGCGCGASHSEVVLSPSASG